MLTDQVGDAVYIRGNKNSYYKVARADTAQASTMPSIGVIIKKWGFTDVLVQMGGPVLGIYTGLTAGQTYWVGPTGSPVGFLPAIDGATQRAYTQVLGVALDADVLLLKPAPVMFIRRG